MINKCDCLNIGSIVKTHGVSGELMIGLEKHFLAELIDPDFFFLELDNGLVPFAVASLRDRDDHTLLVKLELCLSEKEGSRLVGTPVWISKDDFNEAEIQPSVDQLIGYKVIDILHGEIGTISDIVDPERNPLFVVKGKHDEILLPVAEEFVIAIDDDKKIIRMKTPDGLLDLYL